MVNGSVTWCARAAIVGTVLFFVIMYIVFLFVQPELNPLHRWGSEYAVGRMGWLMKGAFFCWGVGLFALALAIARGLDRAARSKVGIAFLVVGAAGIFSSGVFDTDLQIPSDDPSRRWTVPPATDEGIGHIVSGLVGLPSLMIGAGFISRRLRIAGRLRGRYRWVRALAWLNPVAFLTSIMVFGPLGLAGLGQRIFLLVLFSWVILVARGLDKGAFLRT